MEDENKQIELPKDEALVVNEKIRGSGSLLAAERQKQSKKIEDIAGDLNLSVSQIKNIESDQTGGLPEATYVRGYIRSYAKLLGLDPEEILKSYLNPNWQNANSLIDIPSGIGELEEPKAEASTLMKTLGFLAVILVLGVLWYSGIVSNLISSKPAQDAINSPIEAIDEALNEIDLAEENIDLNDQLNQDVVEDTADLVMHVLLFTFQETSWVDIRDENNNRLAYQSYAKGEELLINSESNLIIFLGNAAGVTVQYNGSNYDITKYKQGVYAKFSIGN